MRVLHFCIQSENDDGIVRSYISTLLTCMASMADVKLLTSNNKNEAKEFQPELVHIHDCWNHPSAEMAKWAHSHNIPVVISPHGKLNPWIVDQKYLHEKLPKLLLYQHEMICNADAIVVSGEMERLNMSELSWNEHLKSKLPWNSRIEIIKNSIITNDINDVEMTRQMMQLYRKVLDSNAWMLMNDETRIAENALLRTGVAHDEQSDTITDEQIGIINRLDEGSWRKILIHADEEDVLDIVMKAVHKRQFNAPNIAIKQIERFSLRVPKPTGPLERKKLLGSSLKTKFKSLRHDFGDCLELDICRMIANASFEMHKTTLSRHHLADIYEEFRYVEFDEDKFAKMLKYIDMIEFVNKLQETLEEMFGLTEGFMPIPPRTKNTN